MIQGLEMLKYDCLNNFVLQRRKFIVCLSPSSFAGVVKRDGGLDLPGPIRSGMVGRGGHGDGEVGRPRFGRGKVLVPLFLQR